MAPLVLEAESQGHGSFLPMARAVRRALAWPGSVGAVAETNLTAEDLQLLSELEASNTYPQLDRLMGPGGRT
jgi:hypothetical protein